jgi:hypothetical protein
MRVHVGEAAQLATLANWLADRGWPVVDAAGVEAEVLVPWEEDEFAAALKLRVDVAAWQAANGGAQVSVDDHVWVDAGSAR